jgi:DNA modification methylase
MKAPKTQKITNIEYGVKIPVNKVHPNPWNPNGTTDREQEAIQESLNEFGQVLEVLVRPHPSIDGAYQIIDGEHRYLEMSQDGIIVANILYGISDIDAKRLTIVMNQTRGKPDKEKEAVLLAEIKNMQPDTFGNALPYTPDELDELIAIASKNPNSSNYVGDDDEDGDGDSDGNGNGDGNGEEDEAPAADAVEIRVKLGDLVLMGNHRLVCGDCTNRKTIALLMDGKKAVMCFTDPPYNVDYDPESRGGELTERQINNPLGKIKNDKMTDLDFRKFLDKVYTSIDKCMTEGCPIYMGRADYQWKHEPILYGWKEGASHIWHGDRKQTTIVECATTHLDKKNCDTDGYVHPTQKPTPLVKYFLGNSSQVGDLILDLFGGSGTTLIACDELDRICYTTELDERFANVIATRWENFSGGTIKIIREGVDIGDGKSFDLPPDTINKDELGF